MGRRRIIFAGGVSTIALAIVLLACGLDVAATGTAYVGSEASTATDAPARQDAGDAPVGTAGFCARETVPFFACWDFDDVPAGGDAGFDDTTTAMGIEVEAEGTNRVLRQALPDQAATRNSWLRRTLTTAGQLGARYDVRFAFAVRKTTLGYAAFGALFLTTPQLAQTLGVAAYDKAGLDMMAPDRSTNRVPFAAGATWHAARLTATLSDATFKSRVAIDDIVVQEDSVPAQARATVSVDLRLGAFYTSAELGGVDVAFDDVVVRIE